MPLPEFGPFSAAFDRDGLRVPGYLTLLNLQSVDADAQTVMDRIERALAEGRPSTWLTVLLADVNWRPHLVAAVAYLLAADHHTLEAASLWKAMDAGSWVTPQLAVAAFFTDPWFATRAAERIEQHGPIKVPELLSPVERHSATGPAGLAGRSGKLLASLLSLCHLIPALAAREAGWRTNERTQVLLDKDAAWDRSDRITLGWMAAVQSHLQQRGQTLSPPAAT